MTSIVYGIVDAASVESEALPAGWNGTAIVVARHGKLAALLSPLPEGLGGAAGAEQVLEFAGVVEELHRRMTILPMRFGSLVHRREQAEEFLRLHERELSDALAAVEGCDEMGLRLLIRDLEPSAAKVMAEAPAEVTAPEGIAYLESRRRYYEQQRRMERACQDWADRIEAALTGLFLEVRQEHAPAPNGQLLSLSFLVERSRVDAFLEGCRALRAHTSAEAICTGPWPPYSFAPALVKSDRG